MGTVEALHGGTLPTTGEPSLAVVKECEDLLERAKSGDIVGIVVVSLHADMSLSSAFEGASTVGMIGSLAIRSAELVERHK